MVTFQIWCAHRVSKGPPSITQNKHAASTVDGSLRPRPKFEIIWVCETPPLILYSGVAIFPARFRGKRDVAHLNYVKIKPYLISLLFLQRWRGFKLFPQQKVSDETKSQNASKRQITIIYFYVIKMPPYKIIPGDSQTHIISNLGLGRRLSLRMFNTVTLPWSWLACTDRAAPPMHRCLLWVQSAKSLLVLLKNDEHTIPGKLFIHKAWLCPLIWKKGGGIPPTCRLGSECYFCFSAITMPVSCL